MTNARITKLQNELTKLISMAIVAQSELQDAQREAGLRAPSQFFTAQQMETYRETWQEDMISMTRYFSNPNAPEYAHYGRIGRGMVNALKNPPSAAQVAQWDKLAQAFEARDLLAEREALIAQQSAEIVELRKGIRR